MSHLTSIKLGAVLVASAAMFAWQPASAQCSTAAWSAVEGTATAGSPVSDPAVRRYSGRCGLSATLPATGYVVESTSHSGEGVSTPLRARFFVFPGVSGGSVTLFQGMDAGNNPVVQVHYNAATGQFQFQTPNGTGTTATTAPASRWYRIEVVYQANQALSASVRGNGGLNYAVSGLPNAGAAGVDAVRLGAISGTATGAVFVDEYEASRAESGGPGVFTTLVRGDADGNGVCNSSDITAIARDFLFTELGPAPNRQAAAGQPDCTEDGAVNSSDITCLARRIIDFDLHDIPCN
jgi:hypothetical protein